MNARRDHILLVGMMGSGKTTVGQLLARRLRRPFFDSDTQVESATGKTVPEIFATEGEESFRAAEREALDKACASRVPSVIAVAGGAVLDPINRRVISSSGRVVFLRATTDTLIDRLGNGDGRPLLEGNVSANVRRLDSERRPHYDEVASITIAVDDVAPSSLADEALERLHERVTVDLGERSYDVVIGPGVLDLVDFALPTTARQAVVVTQANIGVMVTSALPQTVVSIESGEDAKTLRTVEELCRKFAQIGLARSDVVIAVGGGVVTDVAGFAAATYHRGTAVINVATTLLGQIDAAIGGKTGVNLPEGKNLVGAFFQPNGVICDTDVLQSLPEREFSSGLGEMAKYAFLGVDDLDRLPLAEQVARCAALKAEVVSGDERESGRRAILNYGHTLAHTLEAAGFAEGQGRDGIDLRHGEAVSIGVVFAARLAHALGRIDDERVQRHLEVVSGYGLPTAIPKAADSSELVDFMERDKKAAGDLTFVLDGPNGVELVHGVDRAIVDQTLRRSIDGES